MKQISFIAFIALAAITAPAQHYLGTNGPSYDSTVGQPGIYPTVLSGGTNIIAGASTNLYTNSIVQPVSGHPNAGLDLAYTCPPGATNGNIVVSVARSFNNGATFETTPYFNFTNALPTAVQWAAGQTNFVFELDMYEPCATHLQIVSMANTGAASATVSNVVATWNLNQPTIWTISPPR